MNTKRLFYDTLVISIIVQLITGIIEFGAFIKGRDSIIRELLIVELLVQVLEGAFYAWLAFNFTKANITPKRYIDWVITTPSMLITLMVYLIYLREKRDMKLFAVLKENANVFIPVLALNWIMLFFGYLSETKRIPQLIGVFLGFIPFLLYYYLIYVNCVTQSTAYLFWYFFGFWSLYGVVAILPYYIKNSCYNILDLFAKNFFGIFLSYLIFFDGASFF